MKEALASVRRLRGEFEFGVRLIKQLLGLRRMPAQIPLVGLLRRGDLIEGLVAEALRGSQVRVPLRTHIRWRLGQCCGCNDDAEDDTCEYPILHTSSF